MVSCISFYLQMKLKSSTTHSMEELSVKWIEDFRGLRRIPNMESLFEEN